MDHNKDIGMNTGTGSISVLAIFVVLCLTTLATLSLVSARADHVLAEKTARSAVEYYEADSKAEERLASVAAAAAAGGDWERALRDMGCTVETGEGAAAVAYSVPVNDIKDLFVEVGLTLSGGAPTGELTRLRWQTQVVETDEPGEIMNVFQ